MELFCASNHLDCLNAPYARDDPDALSVVYCELRAPVGPRASISSMIAILITIIVTLVTHDAKLSQKNRLPKGATLLAMVCHGQLQT